MKNEKPKPHAEKSINFKFFGVNWEKKFVENSRYAWPKRWERRAALKKRHFAKFQRLSHFCKTKNPNGQKKRGRGVAAPQTPCGKINSHFKFVRTTRAKDSLQALAARGLQPTLGPPPSKRHFAKFQRLFALLQNEKPKWTKKAGRSEARPQTLCGKINKLQNCQRNASKNICCKLSLCAAQELGAARRSQKTAFCQISQAFAFLQKEKNKLTKKRGAASLRPQTPCGKINKLQICPRNASKKIRCKLSLRAAQALGAALFFLAAPQSKINQTSKVPPRNARKKIRCKLSLRVAQALGAACHSQKTGLCQISKDFTLWQNEKPKSQKSRGRSFAAPQTPCGKINKLQIYLRNASKKIRCKLSLRSAFSQNLARRLQQTVFCQIPKTFALLQKKNPN